MFHLSSISHPFFTYNFRCEEDVFSRFCILDARGKVAATLNMAVGKGTEVSIMCSFNFVHLSLCAYDPCQICGKDVIVFYFFVPALVFLQLCIVYPIGHACSHFGSLFRTCLSIRMQSWSSATSTTYTWCAPAPRPMRTLCLPVQRRPAGKLK